MGKEYLSPGIAFIIFSQSLGPAILFVLCNVNFDSSLGLQLHKKLPQIDTIAITKAGATGFRAIVPVDDLPSVLAAYANSVDWVFYLVVAVASACALALWGMGWHDLRKKGENTMNRIYSPGKQGG